MKHHAVVFDLFGTLIDNFTTSSLTASLERMAAAVGAPGEGFCREWRATYVERNIGVLDSPEGNIREVCRRVGVTPTAEGLAEAARLRLAYTASYLTPREGAVETLTAIRASGRGLALVSDCSAETPALWDRSAFAPLFDVTIFSCRLGTKKPDARMYLAACEGLGVAPEACLYVGDGSSQELAGAAAVGMHPVLIRAPHEEHADAFRPGEAPWEGPRITALGEVMGMLG